MSLQGFVDHCCTAREAIEQWMLLQLSDGEAVQGDYLADAQEDADAARQYLQTAANEIEAACKLSESIISEVSDDVANTILAVTASAKRNTPEFFECWHKNEPALLLAAVRERIKPELQPKDAQAYADKCLVSVLREFDETKRPRDDFYHVVKLAVDLHGVYELTSKSEIARAVEAAQRQVELLYPKRLQQETETQSKQTLASDMPVTVSTQDACRMLDRNKSTLKRWADDAGIQKVMNNVWKKSDIKKLARLHGIEL